jgi:hypothetical protein
MNLDFDTLPPRDDSMEKLLSYHRLSLENEINGSLDDGVHRDDKPSVMRNQYQRTLKTQRWMLYSAIAFVAVTIFYGLGFYTHIAMLGTSKTQPVNQTQATNWSFCGNSSVEARSNGCILDFISGAWVRPDCYDEELEKEFLEFSDWHWFADREAQHELSKELLRETGGPSPIWVSNEYHRQHCKFTWRKLHRAIIRQTPIDSQVGRFTHTLHCSESLVRQGVDPAPIDSTFYPIFTYCDLPQNCKHRVYLIIYE